MYQREALGLVGILRRYGLDHDVMVFGQRVGVGGGVQMKEIEPHEAPPLVKQGIVLRGEKAVLRCCRDRHMKRLVRREHLEVIVGQEGVVEGGSRDAHGRQLLLGPPLCRQAGADPLREVERLDVSRKVRELQRGHDRRPVGQHDDEVLGGEPAQRLADRRAGTGEAPGDLGFVERRARREIERQDLALQGFVHESRAAAVPWSGRLVGQHVCGRDVRQLSHSLTVVCVGLPILKHNATLSSTRCRQHRPKKRGQKVASFPRHAEHRSFHDRPAHRLCAFGLWRQGLQDPQSRPAHTGRHGFRTGLLPLPALCALALRDDVGPSRLAHRRVGQRFGIPRLGADLRPLSARRGYYTCISGKMHFVGPDQLARFRGTPDHGNLPRGLLLDARPRRNAMPRTASARASPRWRPILDAGPMARTMQIDYDEDVVHHAVREVYVRARSADTRPFMMTVSLTQPHDPYVTTREWWDLYEGIEIDPPTVAPIPLDARDPHSRMLHGHYGQDRTEIDAGHRPRAAGLLRDDLPCGRDVRPAHGRALPRRGWPRTPS